MRFSTVEGCTAVCRWPIFGPHSHRHVGLFGVDLLVVAPDDESADERER